MIACPCTKHRPVRIPEKRPLANVRRGEQHQEWKGDAASSSSKWARARHKYVLTPCDICGEDAMDFHHIDGNNANNSPENVAALCRRCHMSVDGRLEKFRRIGKPREAKTFACRICGRVKKPYRHGRCPMCSCYFILHGKERPINHPGRGQRHVPKMKTCAQCEQEFDAIHDSPSCRKKFCSTTCYHEHQRKAKRERAAAG